MMKRLPVAYARLSGSPAYPLISGNVLFYDTYKGTIVAVEINGVTNELGEMATGFYGFHVHARGPCSGTAAEPFADAGGHYNPRENPHPYHAGDLPVLLMNHGYAWMQFYTERFYPEEVIGKTAIVHAMPDDYHSQPAGDSGKRIACGEIKAWE